MADPVLVVHGGAWAMPDDMVEAHIHGVKNALAAGWRVLDRGGAAVDAVEEAIVVMEDDETFDAGRGSFLNPHCSRCRWMRSSWTGAAACGRRGCGATAQSGAGCAQILSESPHVYFVLEGRNDLPRHMALRCAGTRDDHSA